MGSPASGDQRHGLHINATHGKFPFNWDPQRVGTLFPSKTALTCSTFPFNWDPQRVGTLGIIKGNPKKELLYVSIQLGSPASGDNLDMRHKHNLDNRFPFNWDPQRVGTKFCSVNAMPTLGFPFNWDPQRVGTQVSGRRLSCSHPFPFNWDPQRVGTLALWVIIGKANKATQGESADGIFRFRSLVF